MLLVRTNGNPEYVGRSAVFTTPDTRTWLYASYLLRVRLHHGLLPEYLNVFLGMERGRRELLRRVTTSAGNHNINSHSIRLVLIAVPERLQDQERIVELARACRNLVSALEEEALKLSHLKRSLAEDLFTGHLDAKTAVGAMP